jgi:hypothetical protein
VAWYHTLARVAIASGATTMRRPLPRSRQVLGFAGLVLFAVTAATPLQPTTPRVPESTPFGGVTWSELAYSAHKFFLGAATTIRVEDVSAGAVAAALLPAPSGRSIPIPGGAVAAVTVDTHLPFGRDESVRLFFDPLTGAAVGGEKTMRGGSPYHKLFRYTQGGLFTWRSAPADDREAARPPGAWSHRKAYLVQPAVAPPPGAPVADSYALIYLVSAAHLKQRGDSRRLYMLADDRFIEMTFSAGGLTQEHATFEEVWPGGRRLREGDVLVRQVRVTARVLDAASSGEDVELGFLGMRGTLTVELEVGTELPVRLSGSVQHLGKLTVRLRRAVLKREPPSESRQAPQR